MRSLDNQIIASPPFDSFEWKTPKKQWKDLPQIADELEMPASGVLEENRIWVDEYSVHHGWRTFKDRMGKNPNNLGAAFSVTPSNVLHIHEPTFYSCEPQHVAHIKAFVEEMNIPSDAWMKWDIDDDKWQRITVGQFKSLVQS